MKGASASVVAEDTHTVCQLHCGVDKEGFHCEPQGPPQLGQIENFKSFKLCRPSHM